MTENNRVARIHPNMIVICSLVWVLLWGELSIPNLLMGALLGLLIGVVFPLPAIRGVGRPRPIGILRLVGRLLFDLVRSSIAVIGTVIFIGPRTKNAIVGVKLRTRSDFYQTQTAEQVSLVPGSLVVEARRSAGTLYIHVFDIKGPEDVDAAKQMVLEAEARVVRAFGTREELDSLRTGAPMPVIDDGEG